MLHVGMYKTKTYTAYFYADRIVITTKIQSFKIVCIEHYDAPYLEQLKLQIINGKIEAISDLPYIGGKLLWETCKRPSIYSSPSLELTE